MDLLSLEKNPQILCLGDRPEFINLFEKISNYRNSFNNLKIDEFGTNLYKFKIDTKYYDLELILELVEFEFCIPRIESILKNQHLLNNIQSVFILVDENISKYFSKIEALIDKLDQLNENNSCLNVLINNGDFQIGKEIEVFSTKRDFIKIKLNSQEKNLSEEEDQFSNFDELINSILVHSWEGMNLKSDKKTIPKSNYSIDKKIDLLNNEFEDKNLNVEDLMMNLRDIREKSMNLDFEERKKYAENITVNFWNSIGGDPEELNGLNDEK